MQIRRKPEVEKSFDLILSPVWDKKFENPFCSYHIAIKKKTLIQIFAKIEQNKQIILGLIKVDLNFNTKLLYFQCAIKF